MEKQELLFAAADEKAMKEDASSQPRTRKLAIWTFFPLWIIFYLLAFRQPLSRSWHLPMHTSEPSYVSKSRCAQVPPLRPQHETKSLKDLEAYLDGDTFRNLTIAHMSQAVQIDTQSYDDLGEIGVDKRWDVMYPFADFLKDKFPKVHSELRLETINTHGLLYTWNGSDSTVKPLLLMAHQDVVPVPDTTLGSWTHPPFSGFYDGKFIWGRGSSDCKNSLIAILEALETLLAADFRPRRSIVVALGFDEEISGPQGAGHLAPHVLERYGKHGIAAIVDEGTTFETAWGQVMAKPAVAEKGYTDVDIIVRMPGGHSSIPSDHTSIGVAGEIATAIEAEQYPLQLTSDNPYLTQLFCGAEFAPDFPKKLKKLLSRSADSQCPAAKKHDRLAEEAAKAGPGIKYTMQTSQAIDVISGGVKINALPERTIMMVNHRINLGSNVQAVHDHLTHLVAPIAKKHNLDLHAFDGTKDVPNSISIASRAKDLEVAPITPTSIDGTTPYSILSGTTRALYGEDMVVTPGTMTGNTDTKYYWNVSKHIFRFGPGYDSEGDPGYGNIHTVDERITVKGHINTVKWFSLFIRNMDEAEL